MTAAELPKQRRGKLAAAVAITLVVQTTISTLIACVPVLAPEVATAHGWGAGVITFYAPIICVAAFVVSFLVPDLLVRLGGMGLSLACIAFGAAGVLCVLPPSMLFAAAAPIFIGLANGAMNPASSQVLGPRSTPQTAALVMSIKQTGVPLGGVLAGAIVPLLVLNSGWKVAVLELSLASGTIAAVLLPSVQWLGDDKPARTGKEHRLLEPLKRLLSLPGMPSLQLAAMIFVAMQACLRSFFTVYLVGDLGYTLTAAGMLFSVSQVSGIFGQVGWALLSDRWLKTHTVMAIVGMVMALAAAMAAAFVPGAPLAAMMVVSALYGVTAAGFLPVVFGEIARRAGAGQVGLLTSGANLFIIAGVFTGPLVFGAIAAIGGYRTAFAVFAVLTLVGSVIVVAPSQRRTRIRDAG